MSASLVGSEMCIRDSGYFAGDRRVRWANHAPPYSGLTRPAWQTVQLSLCLLYTSDAADDM
eukprot:14190949-Alexandrium_andersonii.AAC.1